MQRAMTTPKPRAPRYAKERDTPPSLLTQTRKSRGLSLDAVAKEIGTHHTNLLKIENGEQIPRYELAHKIFAFYDEVVPLEQIYFPHGGPATCPCCMKAWREDSPR